MKRIFQISKIFLLCIAALFAKQSAAQTFPVQFVTQQGVCVDLGVDTIGVQFTTFNITSGPFYGQLTPGIRPGSWVYCPDSNFVGNDYASVYYCISGPTFPICDSALVTFVVQPNGCNLIVNITNGSPCAGPLPSITATATGGTPPYTYQWSTGQTGQYACNLTSGMYCLTVTDAQGCYATGCYTVGCQFPVTIGADTSGCLLAAGSGSPPYTYLWSTNETTPTICNVPLATYCVTMTDAQGCTGYACFTSGGCNLSAAIQVGGCAGPMPSLYATAAGGTPPYYYVWNTGDASQTICNLTPGVYCVTVMDANSCSATTCDTIAAQCLTVTVGLDSTGCLLATPTSGTGPYTYLWSNNATTGSICNVNPVLSYCVTITDVQGCSGSACYQGTCTMTSTIVPAGPYCLQVVSTGGTPPYSYAWSNGFFNGPTICPNTAGTYCVTITDSQGCTDFICGTTTGCNLNAVITQSGNCLAVTATGGSGSYTYAWSNGSTASTICDVPGTYCLTLTDAQGCTASACGTINSGCQMGLTIVPDSSGCLVAVPSGGSAPYTYYWDRGDSTGTICNINPGDTYCLSVSDAQGCMGAACSPGTGCHLLGTITQAGGCLVVTATGGTPPYYFVWDNGFIGPSMCPGLPGTYCVIVSDSLGCTFSLCGTVSNGCQLTVTLVPDSLNQCYTPAVSGGTPPYTYMWSDGSTDSVACGFFPGASYCITVADANGCTASSCSQNQGCSFTYSGQSNPLDSTYLVVFTANDPNNFPYRIDWNIDGFTGSGSGNAFTYLYDSCNVNSFVTMTEYDILGNILCTYSQSIYIFCDTFYRNCQAYFTAYQTGTNPSTFQFYDQSVYYPVAYQWNFGDGTSSTVQNPQHTFSSPGTYNVCVVVTDATGCTSTYCQAVTAGGAPVQDLAAYLYHYTTVTPGFPVWVDLTYCNYGTTAMSGTVEYRYPNGTTYVSADISPASHDIGQRLLTFNFTNLLPGTCASISVDLTANTGLFIGTPVKDTMWVKPIVGDINPANNISYIKDYVTASWDPNDKAVSPKGEEDDGEIPVNTQTLGYKVRFQNTGNTPATTVVVRDVMDSNIDLTSVRVMEASHEHITQIIGNELVVTFDNIMLPDSNSNEPASHGYIQIVANLKPGLTEGTQIFNTASIYFDFNEPIITNTVVNTLKDQGTGIKSIADLSFSIVPNPANDQITFSGKFGRNSMYEIMNELGQVVLSDDVHADQMQVDVTSLEPGIYFVRIKSNDRVGVERMVIGR